MDLLPQRIVCLTEETTEMLYLLGEQDRIVGISGFTRRPAVARKEKPIISTFLDAKYDEILALKPDLVIGFSDIQAQIAKELVARGVTVLINNHRSVQGIKSMMLQLAALVGAYERGLEIVAQIDREIAAIQRKTAQWSFRPKVYFEEWYDPLIFGIEWVREIVQIAGGVDIFADRGGALAKDRIIKDSMEVVRHNPDIILVSWCGKAYKESRLVKRPSWDKITAVGNKDIYEIPSEIILQPGPAALTDGLRILHQIFYEYHLRHG